MSIDRESFHHLKQELADTLAEKLGVKVYTESLLADEDYLFCLARRQDSGKKLYSASLDKNTPPLPDQPRKIIEDDGQPTVYEFPLSAQNGSALRKCFSFLAPSVIGIQASAGFGDRLGCATPGHVRAAMNVSHRKASPRPVFAQQSTRENLRTGRTPAEVIDDAMWGIIQSGWKKGYGADADHLKTTGEITECYRAGYTFFTIDPGDQVRPVSHESSPDLLREELDRLPWKRLESSWEDLKRRFLGKSGRFGGTTIAFDEAILAVAAVKYGSAIAHTAEMYRHLLETAGGNDHTFELEVSVDETDKPTSIEEHFYIASELRRLGVVWNSLAPRFPGRFEKGVDYQADPPQTLKEALSGLKKAFDSHAAIARELGPYKLSLHSGSDKFSAYPLLAEAAGPLVHLKTAGTSYLEALKVAAVEDPEFFRAIHQFALSRYLEDKVSYHVSADIKEASNPLEMKDNELVKVFESLHDRQILHVTFGSLLNENKMKTRLMEILTKHEETYYNFLDIHFRKHLEPFLQ